jgi:hypothetical protein
MARQNGWQIIPCLFCSRFWAYTSCAHRSDTIPESYITQKNPISCKLRWMLPDTRCLTCYWHRFIAQVHSSSTSSNPKVCYERATPFVTLLRWSWSRTEGIIFRWVTSSSLLSQSEYIESLPRWRTQGHKQCHHAFAACARTRTLRFSSCCIRYSSGLQVYSASYHDPQKE